MYTYKVINRPAGRSYLKIVNFFAKKMREEGVAYHKAPAAKHIVLPTYIGSLRTLKGNLHRKHVSLLSLFRRQRNTKNTHPSTRESIKIPK